MVVIRLIVLFCMMEEFLMIGDDVVYGEEVYVLWGDGEKYNMMKYGVMDFDVFNYGLGVGF